MSDPIEEGIKAVNAGAEAGRQQERERIINLLKSKSYCVDPQHRREFCYCQAIELIKGEQK
jgi:hypothetical protein